MTSRPARLGVLLGGVAALLATMVPPASATTIKTVTFTGVAILSGCDGFSYPGVRTSNLPGTETKHGPKPGTTVVNFTGDFGKTCNFTFVSAATGGCTKTSVGLKAGKTGVDLCVITASGTATGYCGLSTGTGVATIHPVDSPVTGPGKSWVTTVFKFTEVGELVITGGDANTNITGTGTALPFTGSCSGSPFTSPATGFMVSGDFVYKDCTGNTVAGVCTQP